jgi:hypothetical protein
MLPLEQPTRSRDTYVQEPFAYYYYSSLESREYGRRDQ